MPGTIKNTGRIDSPNGNRPSRASPSTGESLPCASTNTSKHSPCHEFHRSEYPFFRHHSARHTATGHQVHMHGDPHPPEGLLPQSGRLYISLSVSTVLPQAFHARSLCNRNRLHDRFSLLVVPTTVLNRRESDFTLSLTLQHVGIRLVIPLKYGRIRLIQNEFHRIVRRSGSLKQNRPWCSRKLRNAASQQASSGY